MVVARIESAASKSSWRCVRLPLIPRCTRITSSPSRSTIRYFARRESSRFCRPVTAGPKFGGDAAAQRASCRFARCTIVLPTAVRRGFGAAIRLPAVQASCGVWPDGRAARARVAQSRARRAFRRARRDRSQRARARARFWRAVETQRMAESVANRFARRRERRRARFRARRALRRAVKERNCQRSEAPELPRRPSGADGNCRRRREMQIDLEVQRGEYAERAVCGRRRASRGSARRPRAETSGPFATIMRELSHSRRRIAAAALNGRLPITFTGALSTSRREIDLQENPH